MDVVQESGTFISFPCIAVINCMGDVESNWPLACTGKDFDETIIKKIDGAKFQMQRRDNDSVEDNSMIRKEIHWRVLNVVKVFQILFISATFQPPPMIFTATFKGSQFCFIFVGVIFPFADVTGMTT